MSKYNSLWEYVQKNGSPSFKLTFDEINNIAGIPILVENNCLLFHRYFSDLIPIIG